MLSKRLCRMLIALVLIAATGMSSIAQEETPAGELTLDEEPLATDAAVYADTYDISLDEAIWRLELQEPASELQVALTDAHSDVLGGVWIEHEPEFRIVVQLTSVDEAVVTPYVDGGPLEGLVEVRPAELTLNQLQAIQVDTIRSVRELDDISFESDINVFENRVELYVTDREAIDSAFTSGELQLSEHVQIIAVESLGDDDANIYGGLPLSTCTSGFSVKNHQGVYGITTAGHCSNTKYYIGSHLPYVYEAWGGPYDVQWHTTPAFTDQPWFRVSSSSYRVITGKKTWAQQVTGLWVCKYGKTTGYTCGHIASKYYQPTPPGVQVFNPIFIRVHHPDGINLSHDGDSGGPWFSSTIAYGVLKGGAAGGNDACYMAVDYIEQGLGVTVLP